MRLNRIIAIALPLIALTSPAAAAVRNCKPAYSELNTSVVEEFLEVGQLEGLIQGGVYLRYDDFAPAINPKTDPPNFVITNKLGNINLWVYSESKPDGGENWWRKFTILRTEGTGIYARQSMVFEIYGKCSAKGGSYEVEGWICSPLLLPPKK